QLDRPQLGALVAVVADDLGDAALGVHLVGQPGAGDHDAGAVLGGLRGGHLEQDLGGGVVRRLLGGTGTAAGGAAVVAALGVRAALLAAAVGGVVLVVVLAGRVHDAAADDQGDGRDRRHDDRHLRVEPAAAARRLGLRLHRHGGVRVAVAGLLLRLAVGAGLAVARRRGRVPVRSGLLARVAVAGGGGLLRVAVARALRGRRRAGRRGCLRRLRVAVAGLGGLGEVRSGRGRGRLRRRGGRLLRLRGLLLGRGRVR